MNTKNSISYDKRSSEKRPGNPQGVRSTLVSKNVTLGGRRTSLRLEQAMWDCLGEVCAREKISLGELCKHIDETRFESTLTAALRVHLVKYYQAAATEEGHAAAGHGTFVAERLKS